MKAKKLAAVALASMFLPALSCCKNKEVSVPEFSGAGGVNFTAYAAPTVERKVDGLTEEHYKKLSEAGFNKAVALYEGASTARGSDTYETIAKRSEKAQADALAALNLAEKYGVKYYVRDWSFYGLGKNFKDITTKEQFEKVISKMFDENNAYIKHSAYGGNFGFDEPDIKEIQPIFIPIFHGDGNFYEFAVVFCKVGIKARLVWQRSIVLRVGFFNAGENVFGNRFNFFDFHKNVPRLN